MIAIDTNVLISLRSKDRQESLLASNALASCSKAGPLCICGPVFSELLGLPGRSANDLRHFFDESGIRVESNFLEADWQAAGLAYQGYVSRRRASGSGIPGSSQLTFW